jgi:transketolase N-terminal domain/subunit
VETPARLRSGTVCPATEGYAGGVVGRGDGVGMGIALSLRIAKNLLGTWMIRGSR